MAKIFFVLLALVAAYFVFQKRTDPPKEVQVTEEAVEPTTMPARIIIASATVSAEISVSATTEIITSNAEAEIEKDSEVYLEKDEPRENVDQTVIANEKRLASSRSAAEAFELLSKLRIRIKKLSDISVQASPKEYEKFYGKYEGPVLNRRQESVYNLSFEVKPNPAGSTSKVSVQYFIGKVGDKATTGLWADENGYELVGRDGLVIQGGASYFQIYKLDNGYLAGSYYEKRKASYRVYRFLLKPKN